MLRHIVTIIFSSALYGFSIGLVHSAQFALRNVVKFPLLILVTTAICSVVDDLVARVFSSKSGFIMVQRAVLEIFRDLTVMLASLSPVMAFLAFTIERPRDDSLGEYPLFLGINVCLIAACGFFSLTRHARGMTRKLGFSVPRGFALIICWMTVSLFVGAQWAWYLRPFCGVSSLKEETPFFLGSEPDFRGATSFYEAVYHLFNPP